MNRSYSKIRHIQESNLILEKRLLNEQGSNYDRYEAAGYKEVNDINLPNGSYVGNPTGFEKDASAANLYYVSDLHIYDKSGKSTGYLISLESPSRSGYENVDVVITDKKANMTGTYFFKDLGYKPTEQSQPTGQTQTLVNKVSTEGIKNVSDSMIQSPPFKGYYSGYVIGGTFGGVNYEWDFNGVEGMSGVRGMVDGQIICDNNTGLNKQTKKEITDAIDPGFWLGFYSSQSKFVCYMTTNNTPKVVTF